MSKVVRLEQIVRKYSVFPKVEFGEFFKGYPIADTRRICPKSLALPAF